MGKEANLTLLTKESSFEQLPKPVSCVKRDYFVIMQRCYGHHNVSRKSVNH